MRNLDPEAVTCCVIYVEENVAVSFESMPEIQRGTAASSTSSVFVALIVVVVNYDAVVGSAASVVVDADAVGVSADFVAVGGAVVVNAIAVVVDDAAVIVDAAAVFMLLLLTPLIPLPLLHFKSGN